MQASEDANAETQAWVGYVLLGLVIVFCTFAVFNTLMLAISERGREFGLLQLVGGTRRQVVTMMGLEAVMVVITGLVARCRDRSDHRDAGRQGGHWFVSAAHATDLSWPYSSGMTVVIGLVGTMLPTIARLRPRPVEAIGVRE